MQELHLTAASLFCPAEYFPRLFLLVTAHKARAVRYNYEWVTPGAHQATFLCQVWTDALRAVHLGLDWPLTRLNSLSEITWCCSETDPAVSPARTSASCHWQVKSEGLNQVLMAGKYPTDVRGLSTLLIMPVFHSHICLRPLPSPSSVDRHLLTAVLH